MLPIKFPFTNLVYAEDQPQYLPLPVIRFPEGETVQAWELSDEEIEVIKKNKRIYVSQLTFKEPLQPIKVGVKKAEMFPQGYAPITRTNLKPGDKVVLSLNNAHRMGTCEVLEVFSTLGTCWVVLPTGEGVSPVKAQFSLIDGHCIDVVPGGAHIKLSIVCKIV